MIGVVGLEEKADALVRKLSGGQRRRLDFGLALVGDPELIFLDEPTTGFDPAARRAAWETIRSLRELGKTILLTTHYLDEAEQLSDRVAVLRDGRIVATGTPAELTRTPATEIRYRENGREVVLRTEEPTRVLAELTARARRAGRGARRARSAAAVARRGLPRADGVRLFLHELRGQLVLYTRSKELAFFTFLLPLILFVLLGSTYGDDRINGDRGANFLEAGMLGYGLVSTAFAGLAIFMVIRRESGILKRVRATPLPASTYLSAVLGSTLIAFAVNAACMIAIGRGLFSVPLPDRWLSLVLTLLLGAAAFAALGLAMTVIVRSAEGASATVNAVYLPMAFISGSFFSPHSFPEFLRAIANVLPLTYFIRLTRDVMLHGDQFWDSWGDVAVVAAWGAFGAIVAFWRFRWEPSEG